MQIKMVGRVFDVNESNGVSYVTFLDVEAGGMVKLSIPGVSDLKVDSKLDLDVTVKPGIGKYGQYLKVTAINPKEKGG